MIRHLAKLFARPDPIMAAKRERLKAAIAYQNARDRHSKRDMGEKFIPLRRLTLDALEGGW